MERALILTAEAAEAAGLSGPGPFTFSGSFPGVWTVGDPVSLTELGFQGSGDQDDAAALVKSLGLPLEELDVEPGEAKGWKGENHILSDREARELEALEDPPQATGKIRTHAHADARARELGFSFPDPKATVPEKIKAIEAVEGGAPPPGSDLVAPEFELETGEHTSIADAEHERSTGLEVGVDDDADNVG